MLWRCIADFSIFFSCKLFNSSWFYVHKESVSCTVFLTERDLFASCIPTRSAWTNININIIMLLSSVRNTRRHRRAEQFVRDAASSSNARILIWYSVPSTTFCCLQKTRTIVSTSYGPRDLGNRIISARCRSKTAPRVAVVTGRRARKNNAMIIFSPFTNHVRLV